MEVCIAEPLGDVFFFSSRRRHPRCSRDWSSDVCSSDLRSKPVVTIVGPASVSRPYFLCAQCGVGRSEERRVGKSVDLGGRRIIKKKKKHRDDRDRRGEKLQMSQTKWLDFL